MFKKILENFRWLIKSEKNSEKKQVLKETLKSVKQENKELLQQQKQDKKDLRKLQSIRGYWNKESNTRAEKINNLPKLISSNPQIYKLKNKISKTVEGFLNSVKSRILPILEINKKVIYTLSIHLIKTNALKTQEIIDFHCIKPPYVISNEEEKEKSFDALFDFYITKISEEMLKGSGWQLKSIDFLQIKLLDFSPLKGGYSVDLPDSLKNSNSILHFRNNNKYCLKYALTYGVFSGNSKINAILKRKAYHLNWDSINFPASGHDIKTFEKKNPFSVFSYGLDKKYFIYYRSENKNPEINVFFYQGHFFPVKDEKLFHKTLFKSRKNCHVCKICLNNFKSEEFLNLHKNYCQKEYKCRLHYPKSGDNFFKKYSASMFHPIAFYMDIEAKLTPVFESAGPKTTKYQKHEFLYLGLYEVNKITGKNIYREFDNLDKFADFMYEFSDNLGKHIEKMKNKIPNIKKEDYPSFCDYCKKCFNDDAVIHHSHFTGEFLGIVHRKCNLLLRKNKFIPVFCHNFGGYDEKFIIRHFGALEVLAKNLENFINLRCKQGDVDILFLDSMKFLNSSLEKIVESLNGNTPFTKKEIGTVDGKGIFPYDYITHESVLEETKLPDREFFFSKLYNEECSIEKYEKAQKMWDYFGCKTLRDYLLLYLKMDTILLADIFENFRKLSFSKFGLDPAHYLSLPGFSFDCFLKSGNIFLEKITDPTMYNFIESGIKGGESFIAKRYAKANNKYMKNYDPKLPSSFLIYMDATSLYPTNMKKPIPYKNFKFVKNFDWENNDCFLDVDVYLPEHLHHHFRHYPLFPEHINGKLIGNLSPKKSYITHSNYLKTALKYGYVLEKINNILIFDSAPLMKNYIENNAEMRKQATSDFEKTFWKDLSNIIYGKSIEDVRKRINVVVLNDNGQKYINKPYFADIKNIGEKILIQMDKMAVTLDKPIYIGKTILDNSKAFMADFWYGYLMKKFKNIELLMMDTDSFFFEVFTEDFYEDIREDIDEYFDTSNFSENFKTLSGNSIPRKNKKVLGTFKDELAGEPCVEFIGLRPKQYSFVYGDKVVKKSKGVTKAAMRDITFEDYRNVLFGNPMEGSMNVIRSKNHEIFTETIQKKILDKNDEKREILSNGINTLPWGYKKQIF